jgi:hypothetical protein
MQFALKVAVLECSFIKHSQGILGVNGLLPCPLGGVCPRSTQLDCRSVKCPLSGGLDDLLGYTLLRRVLGQNVM